MIMVESSKPRTTTLKKLARWSPSPNDKKSHIPPLSSDAPFLHVHHDKLQQGSLYIIKIKQVSLAMFEGWNDDMCCFSVLRSEVEPLRWSEARQLPGDFDVYDAFDECGNPPIHLWSRYLKVGVPSNWFSMFEEAKSKQKEWNQRRQSSIIQQQDQNGFYYPPQQQQQIQNGSEFHGGSIPSYSNTDVSVMSLNHQENITIATPSVVASTNIVDPSLMNEDMAGTTTSLQHQPSVMSNGSYVTVNARSNSRQHMLSPSPSYRENIQQQHSPLERNNSIMDREQIRRHLAPGQAIITNRHSSQVTLDTTVSSPTSPLPRESPKLVHHRSKELVVVQQQPQIPEEQSSINEVESNRSTYSNAIEFAHDSDRFSIRSDITSPSVNPTTVKSPVMKSSVSLKTRNRPSVKKMLWGA